MRVARERMSVFLLFLSALRVPLCFFERVSVPLCVAGLECRTHPALAQLLENLVVQHSLADQPSRLSNVDVQIWLSLPPAWSPGNRSGYAARLILRRKAW
jgi:hypothetical protein